MGGEQTRGVCKEQSGARVRLFSIWQNRNDHFWDHMGQREPVECLAPRPVYDVFVFALFGGRVCRGCWVKLPVQLQETRRCNGHSKFGLLKEDNLTLTISLLKLAVRCRYYSEMSITPTSYQHAFLSATVARPTNSSPPERVKRVRQVDAELQKVGVSSFPARRARPQQPSRRLRTTSIMTTRRRPRELVCPVGRQV